jgi:hypothetical protein
MNKHRPCGILEITDLPFRLAILEVSTDAAECEILPLGLTVLGPGTGILGNQQTTHCQHGSAALALQNCWRTF